jgi:hypothetical protein
VIKKYGDKDPSVALEKGDYITLDVFYTNDGFDVTTVIMNG